MDYRIYRVSKKEKLVIFIVAVISAAAIGNLFYDTYLSVVVSPFIYWKMKKFYGKKKLQQRKKDMRAQFKDVLYSFSTSFSLGHHMEEAMTEASEELKKIWERETYMKKELDEMNRKIIKAGENPVLLWQDFANRSGIEDIRDFAGVYVSVRETGGNLPRAVNRAAAVITDKIGIENEIETMVSERKLEGRIIGVMPIAVLAGLKTMSPDYIGSMYKNPAGILLMTIALVGIAVAWVMAERITSIEV